MKKSVKNILIITLSSLLCACNNGGNTPSPSNNKDETPYTRVTLTEEGARRINAASERQNRVRNELRKYSNWLMPKYLSLDSKIAVNPGDEVDEDMNFEIYPSDFDNLNKMFLIGRTKPSSSEAKGSTNLINITTNIPEEEISDYSLNGQISYLDGAGDINHDRIEYDSIPYQKETEFTMTYTYIKKGTAADTSPYSCQPSFHLTKIDNEAPALAEGAVLNISLSYSKTGAALRAALVEMIGEKFEVNDLSLTKTVTIPKTDAELEALRSTAVAAAQADANHEFTAFNLPFTVSTSNASTDELTASVLLVDDIEPTIKRNGSPVSSIELNGGLNNKLPHKNVIEAGVANLLAARGYEVVDDIEGVVSLDIGVSEDGNLLYSHSYNYENMISSDSTTKFSYEYDDYLGICHYRAIDTRKLVAYTFDYMANDHNVNVVCSRPADANRTEDVLVVDDLVLNKNTDFEETLIVATVSGSLYAGNNDILIINSSGMMSLSEGLVMIDAFRGEGVKMFISFAHCLPTKEYQSLDGGSYELVATNLYTDAASYDKVNYWYDKLGDLEECFAFKVKGGLENANYNTSLEAFKTAFNINY